MSITKQGFRWTKILAPAALAIGLAAPTSAGEHPAEEKRPVDKDVYPLSTCVVTGEKLGAMGDPVIYQHDGREIRFCCKGCISKFEKEPAAYLQKIDKALVKQQVAFYPMETCPITGAKLGSMGDPVEHIHNNRLVRFCCSGCVKPFEKDAAKHFARLNKATIEAQKKDYPLETCPITGAKLGSMGEPVEYVVANHLVRFCCKGCIKAFEKEPARHLSALDKAWKDQKERKDAN